MTMPLKRVLLNYLANLQMRRAINSSLYVRNDPKDIISKYGPKFLDFGCVFGNVAVKVANDGFSVCAFDINENAIFHNIKLKKNYASFLLATGEAVPFKGDTFDVIYSNHVLEHIPDDNVAVREMNRVLRRGGCLLINIPNINNLHTRFRRRIGCEHPFADPTHLREYNVTDVVRLLKANGFSIKSVDFSDFLPPIGSSAFHYFVILFNLREYINLIGSKFPQSCLSINIVAEKKEEDKIDKRGAGRD